MEKIVIGLDIETYDPELKERGYSWKFGLGHILCTALYHSVTDRTEVIAGLHTEYCTEKDRVEGNRRIKEILMDERYCVVGANIQYDIGWLLYEYGMTTYDVKCSFVDVIQAEHILDEFIIGCSLEYVSQKYLNYGKRKAEIEDWVLQNVHGARGDFRKYLKEAPWNLLVDYVSGDAENPCKVWSRQLVELKAQDLCRRVKLEFDCILPTLQITMNGYPFDNEKRKENRDLLEYYRDVLETQFRDTYNVPDFNVNSSRHIAAFCDKQGIPYSCKITITGKHGLKFIDYKERDDAFADVKRNILPQIQFVKSEPVAYVPSTQSARAVELLGQNGYMCNCSPNVDKHFFAAQRDNYPAIALIADWKLCNGILSKILGDEFERFVSFDKDGQTRIRPQFNITDTVSFRFSSAKANLQQIPSKGGFSLHHKDSEDTAISFPSLTRALFTAEKGQVLVKADYGQVEYRLICNIAVGPSGEEVREEYKKNPKLDFHQYTVDLTGLSRKYAKNMSFGISFGMGIKSMASTFGWTQEKAEEIYAQYNEHLPFVAPTLEAVGTVAKKRGYIRTVHGSHARLPNPNKTYTMLNRYTQGSGAEILKTAIVAAYKEGLWQRINVKNTIHDELNMSVPPTEQGVLDSFRMCEIMRTSTTLKVPLEVEPEIGMNWVDVKTVAEWLELRDNNSMEWSRQPKELKDYVEIAEKLNKAGKIEV